MKLAPDVTFLWGTYFGGTRDKFPSNLCLDADPVDGIGCINLMLSPWGLGGIDIANAVGIDPAGEVLIAGDTNAMDFPTMGGALSIPQTNLSNIPFDQARPSRHYYPDGFVSRFSSGKGQLRRST
ncbi:MAG: hypothetical protein ACI9MR_002704 [Myxococcota bacterium]|jgi:hypothetical protein